MSMPEQISRTERRRAERLAKKTEREKKEARQKIATRLQKAIFYLVAVVLVAGAGYWGYNRWVTGSPGQFVPSLGNRHLSEAEIGLSNYNSDPPTSGPHLPMIASWGIHAEPIVKELQVHNLEDAGVVVQYNCSPASPECKTLVDQLAGIVRRYDRAVLAPYPGMSNKIALTAWSRIDKFNDFDEKRIVRFIEAYIGIDHHPAGGE
jgi:hypothetical protein